MLLLFTYGTLQQEDIQLSTFGRKLQGTQDCLTGYIIGHLQIENEEEIAASEMESYPIARATGSRTNLVTGVVFEVTNDELRQSDLYEGDAYMRVETILESGRTAWVYVEAD